MLPPESAEYFRRLCSKRFADMAVEFSHELREFERSEAATRRGWLVSLRST
jgi:hypothetical protein